MRGDAHSWLNSHIVQIKLVNVELVVEGHEHVTGGWIKLFPQLDVPAREVVMECGFLLVSTYGHGREYGCIRVIRIIVDSVQEVLTLIHGNHW